MAKSNKNDFPYIEGLKIISLIGTGNFSRVLKGVQLNDKTKVAVKVIEKKDLTKGKVDDIVNEIGIMKSLNHRHIVRMKDFKWDAKAVYIILEYCEGGNLNDYIKLHNRLKEKVCRRALQQLALGLAYLRSKNICHMDLKPQNILMNFDPFTLKIADFGLSQYIPDSIYKNNLRGSPLYMAPEILLQKKYNYMVDLWSVGIILYECLFGKAPLAHKNCQELLEAMKAEVPIKYPSTVPISSDCKNLLNGLLTYNPNERISYDDFLSHPFIDLAHAPTEENKRKGYKCILDAVQHDEKKEYTLAFNSYCRGLRYLVPFLDTLTASEERAYLQLKISEYLSRAEELKVVLYKEDSYQNKIVKHWTPEERRAAYETSKAIMSEWEKKGNRDITSLISSDSVVGEADNVSYTMSFVSSATKSEVSESESEEIKNVSSSLTSSSESPGQCLYSTVEEEGSLGEFTPQNMMELFSSLPKAQDALEIGHVGQMYMVQGDYELAFKKYESALSILVPLLKGFPPGFKRDILVHQIRKWLAQAESAKTLASVKAARCGEHLKSGVEATGTCRINYLQLINAFNFIGLLSIFLVSYCYLFPENCSIQ